MEYIIEIIMCKPNVNYGKETGYEKSNKYMVVFGQKQQRVH